MTFERFMEWALYAPGTGYYARADRVIGRAGDFYTSVSVGPLFGFLLGARGAEWFGGGGSEPRVWVEAAAHDGRLAEDVLSAWSRFWPEVLERVSYVILEPCAVRRVEQERRLERWGGRVTWVRDWEEFGGGVDGVIFANELLDAFPLRRFGWDARRREWFEWGVGASEAGLGWCRLPARADPALEAERWPEALLSVLPDGFVVESCPAAVAWWDAAVRRLEAGRLVTIDYGHGVGEAIRPERTGGTVRAYHRHRVSDEVLARPGEQDLTAHVDFEAIRGAGERLGLVTEALTEQGRWLGEVAVGVLRRGGPAAEWLGHRTRQLQTLIHPTHLGRSMKVLVQRVGDVGD